MLLKIKEWFKKNEHYLKLLIISSFLTGLLLPCLSLFFPTFFAVLVNTTPLAFLASMNFPLALLTLSAISIGATPVAIITTQVLAKQLFIIGQQVWTLFSNEDSEYLHTQDSTSFIHSYLKSKDSISYEEGYSEDDELLVVCSDDSVVSSKESLPQLNLTDENIPTDSQPSIRPK